jgi:nucleoside-diphosphate-sugar epimerase
MVPSLIDDLLRGTDPSLTPGTQVWDYLYIDDVIAAICALMDSPSCQGTYNLGSGEPHTVREMAERIRDLIDPALPLTFGTIPYRHNQPMHLIGDISRLRGATGWVPRVGIEDGLRRTVEWYRRNRLREMDKGET